RLLTRDRYRWRELHPAPARRITVLLLDRFAGDFLDGGHALGDLQQAALAQRDHPLFGALAAQVDRRGPHENELTERVGDLEHLVQTHAALVAGLVAVLAARAAHRHHAL